MRPQPWEACLACAHRIGAHQHPRGPCQVRGCDCPSFEWADEGPRVGSLRLCLRWLWRLEMQERADLASPDWIGTLAALRALSHSLGPARAERVVAEEAERWRAQTGCAPRVRAFDEARERAAT